MTIIIPNIAIVTDTVTAVTDFKNKVVGQFDGMRKGIGGFMGKIKDSIVGTFQDTADEVVGSSIVLDMVDDVNKEFKRQSLTNFVISTNADNNSVLARHQFWATLERMWGQYCGEFANYL